MTEKDQPRYYKTLKFHIYNCPIMISVSEEEKDIYEVLVSICFYYKSITAKFLLDRFGLTEKIGQNLLKIMANDLNLLNEDDSKEEITYTLKSNIISDLSKKKTLLISKPFRKQITICEKPLFLTEKYIQYEKEKDFLKENQISSPLLHIQEKIQQEDKKEIFNIPNSYKGIDSNQRTKYLGKNYAKLYFEDNRAYLKFKNLIVGKINRNHPEYSTLLTEYENIKQISRDIDKKVMQEILNNCPDVDIVPIYNSTNHTVEITVNDIELEKFGQIYQIYRTYHDKIQEISIAEDWTYEITIKVFVSDLRLHFWINYFGKLLNMVKQKIGLFLNQSQLNFKKELKKIHTMIPLSDSQEFDPLLFMKYLENLIQNPIDDIFLTIYSKMKENDVIE